jgi:hypothetical protein
MDAGPLKSDNERSHSAVERVERLSYLADMVAEMQDLAAREGCVTLAGLLSLSHAEAQRQVLGSKSPS